MPIIKGSGKGWLGVPPKECKGEVCTSRPKLPKVKVTVRGQTASSVTKDGKTKNYK